MALFELGGSGKEASESIIMPWGTDGVNFSTPANANACVTTGSQTPTTYYTPYFSPNDVYAVACGCGYYGADYAGRVGYAEAYIQRDDGVETEIFPWGAYSYSNAGRGLFDTSTLDPTHNYRVRFKFQGSYYNGRTSTMYAYPILAIKRLDAQIL